MMHHIKERFRTIPECGWACRIDPDCEDRIDLSDGSNVSITPEKDAYLWYDIEGSLIEQFLKGTEDFDQWAAVHAKLRELQAVELEAE